VERKAPMDSIMKTVFDQNGRIKAGSKRIVVTGIGGCGKTQLVRKFIENNQDQ
jgi:GTPase SAR1 family protein